MFGKPVGLREAVVVGGLDMVTQSTALMRRPHVVIATPGRLADHITSCGIPGLERVRMLVLDEADRLLADKSLREDTLGIARLLKHRQTLLFTATLPELSPLLAADHPLALRQPVFQYQVSAGRFLPSLYVVLCIH